MVPGELGTVSGVLWSGNSVNLKPLCEPNESPVSAIGVGNTGQTFFCLPEDILSGTQPVCPPSPFLAPNIDSESIVDVRSERTEEGSPVVPGGSGSPMAGDPAFWTSITEDSWMNEELATCGQPARTDLSLGGSVQSAFVGSEGIADTYDDDGLGEKCRKESVYGADETNTCVWNDSIFPTGHNPVTRPSEFSPAIVFPAKACHDGDSLAFQEEDSATYAEDYDAQSRVIVPTMLPCSTSTLVQNKRIDLPDRPNSTVSETCLVGCSWAWVCLWRQF